ncbi:hypothetical protein NA57DRAFT_53950 [Rhizodiscina lignyota]|uniref:Uncharacterized protein n=1 Tax=Rhizodiscina lignyota TaxID=1504668 RepID=A0A9P4IMM6_9PEZI|nr:hypothetical protein NA57DRAFT_53950 [Rhizodiscina lignyota]
MAGALGKLLPLILLFAFVGLFAWVGYQMYVFSHDLAHRGKKHMEKKNIAFTKDGMRVGVKDKGSEHYEDKTQSVFVKAWNLSSFPNYQSVWNSSAQPPPQRPSYSRSSSSSKSVNKAK